MRKITADAIEAFRMGRKFKRGNTEVEVIGSGGEYGYLVTLKLHGQIIARFESRHPRRIGGGGLYITSAGWNTATTKERLNGLTGVHIQQKNFEWYLNNEWWDGEWIKVE